MQKIGNVKTQVQEETTAKNKARVRPPKARHWCITTFETKNFKKWKELDLADLQIRYLVYQLEAANTGRIHVQGYIETYNPVRLTQLKKLLQDNGLHAEQRRGNRQQARDYCMKDGSEWFQARYPEWDSHGHRIPGTDHVELGEFHTTQGHRTDLDQLVDVLNAGATESEVFEACPSQYLKYSTGIRRARLLLQASRRNQYIPNLQVHVLYGDSRAGKTRAVFDRHGPENVYIPTYSESANKFWFDGYDGQKVLLINEFYGQARTSIMQQILDHYRIQVETKGGSTVSDWDTIYITSNCHPKEWYSQWCNIPVKVEESFINRITTITHMKAKKTIARPSWSNVPSIKSIRRKQSGATSITPATSVPRTPIYKNSLALFTSNRTNLNNDKDNAR